MTTRAAVSDRTAKSAPRVTEGAWTFVRGEGPIVAAAIHDGHDLRSPVLEHVALTDAERLREEDPHTSDWVRIAPSRIVVHRSRFEVDLNRSLDEAVYVRPDQSWGLRVWKGEGPPARVIEEARAVHRAFYAALEGLLRSIEAEHGRFVVYDLHSYNHRRGGPRSPPEDSRKCPDINLGTGTLDRERWSPVLHAFMDALSGGDVLGRKLDVRENVRFRGGYLSEWVHRVFPRSGCVLAVEVKKFYMDEWTGEVEPSRLEAVREALGRTVPRVRTALEGL